MLDRKINKKTCPKGKHICNSHLPTQKQKLQKSLPCQRFFADPEKQNQDSTKFNMRWLKRNEENAQQVTKAIPNKGFGVKLKDNASIEIKYKLKRKCFEIPYWA